MKSSADSLKISIKSVILTNQENIRHKLLVSEIKERTSLQMTWTLKE